MEVALALVVLLVLMHGLEQRQEWCGGRCVVVCFCRGLSEH